MLEQIVSHGCLFKRTWSTQEIFFAREMFIESMILIIVN